MFGVSFPELMLIGAVALIIVGPQRLPGMLGTLGKWSNKLRRMLFDVRQQSGIDDILRAEGISGGLKEIRDLRNAVRGNVSGLLTAGAVAPRQGVQQLLNQPKPAAPTVASPAQESTDPYADVPYDRTREYPDEGCDAYGAIPDDLWAASHPDPKPVSTPSSKSLAPTAPNETSAPSTQVTVDDGAAALATNVAAGVAGAVGVAVAAEAISTITSPNTTPEGEHSGAADDDTSTNTSERSLEPDEAVADSNEDVDADPPVS